MSEPGPWEMPHEPAPSEPRRLLPERPLLLRGAGLCGFAIGTLWLGFAAVQKSAWLAPLAAVLGLVATLAAWASAIHLTGGEKFDDHPFI